VESFVAAAVVSAGLLFVASVALVVRRKWTVVRVAGTSMEPALRDGDRLLARRRRAGHPLHRGDLVVLRPPAGPIALPPGAHAVGGTPPRTRRLLIKRVTALPGDPWTDGSTVPPDHVVVLSDNDGLDSRLFGPVPRDHVTAVVTRQLQRQRGANVRR
jgi:signal peptidase I